jgi:hypothetical protein|tara:strand:+ start:170 stop:508 length:339 start_codon:yes stop_codon:yes gene_type:complete
MKGLGKNTRFKKTAPLSKNYRKGGATEVGKESQSYKEYVKTMYGGGVTEFQGGGHLLKENKRKFKKKELQDKEDKNPRSANIIGVRSKQRLDGKRSRGRKYDRSNARTKFSN